MTGPDNTQPPADPTPPAGSPPPDGSPPPAEGGEKAQRAGNGENAGQAESAEVGQTEVGQTEVGQTADGQSEDGLRSGLRNPAAAVRGVGAGALVIEALILLLAIVPLTKLDTRATGWAIGAVVTLCVLCIALAGLLRYRWAWYAGVVVQVLVCFCGFFHLMLLVFGIIFGAVWAYVLSVRHSVLGEL